MGLFYTNVILYKVELQKVAALLHRQRRVAYVSATQADFTVVDDRQTEDQNVKDLEALAKFLSRKLKCTALASLVHDGDRYLYWLFARGKLLDTYDSVPGYFNEENDDLLPAGGDVEKLCAAFEQLDVVVTVRQIFGRVEKTSRDELDPGELLIGEDIHAALAEALGMPPFAAATGYYTIANADPQDQSAGAFATFTKVE